MRISSITHYRYSLPFKEPLNLGGQVYRHREGILIHVRGHRGEYGWGEAAPLPGFSRESLESVIEQLEKLEHRIIGRELPEEDHRFDFLMDILPSGFCLLPSLRFGLELAFLNLRACAYTRFPGEIFGRPVVPNISLSALLSGNHTKIIQDAQDASYAGFRAIKLKVGCRPVEEDIELLHAVRQIIGPAVHLRVDANQAWTMREAVQFFKATVPCGIEYIEEPLIDADGLERFVSDTGAPVALDETLVACCDREFSRFRFARAIIIKPTLLGGIEKTIRLADQAGREGLYPVVSAAYEAGVGIAGLVVIASILGADKIPAGLDTYRRLSDDVLTSRLPVNTSVICLSDIVEAAKNVDRRYTNCSA